MYLTLHAQEIISVLNEVGAKYTLDDRLDAIATDNGANFVAAVEELMVNGICEEHVWCACHTLQLSIKNHIDPPKPKNAPAPINPTSELIATFRKLVNKIHASPLLTENLRTAQSQCSWITTSPHTKAYSRCSDKVELNILRAFTMCAA